MIEIQPVSRQPGHDLLRHGCIRVADKHSWPGCPCGSIATGPAAVGTNRAYVPSEVEAFGAGDGVRTDHPQGEGPVVRLDGVQQSHNRQRETSRSPRSRRLQDVSMKPFEQVVTEHGATVLRVCRAVVGPVDAEDAWSETFLSALGAYPRLGPAANVRAWLITIAHRKAIDVIRRRGRLPVPVAEVPELPIRACFRRQAFRSDRQSRTPGPFP